MPHAFRRTPRSRTPILIGLIMALLSHLPTHWALAGQPDLTTALETLSSERMLNDIRTLSAPAFNGRQAGTGDDLRSAQWVASAFSSAGLHLPLINNGTVTFPFASGKHGTPLGTMASLVSTSTIQPDPILRTGPADHLTTAALGPDYLPIFDAPTAVVQGPIVFVGYGIVDRARGVDDYASVDVTNHIVFFLRGKPEHYQGSVSHAEKVRWAREHGAVGYLTATGPILSPYEVRRDVTGSPKAFYAQLPPDESIPGAWISTALAERLLNESNSSTPDQLRTLQNALNKGPGTASRRTNQIASLHWDTQSQQGLLVNVIGLLPGTGPDTIVIGAHRDHFGTPAELLFPGADDNASGTAVLLEVARALSTSGLRPFRTILFVSFSGEEHDLLGSRLYVARPPVPLTATDPPQTAGNIVRGLTPTGATRAMINIDHAGIGNGRLTVGVTGMEQSLAQHAGEAAGLSGKLDVFGFFPGGDHVPFKEAGVPTITVVSGGVHPHYHLPTDTIDTINPGVLHTVARYVLALTWQLATQP